jgi:thiamine kinase-like enzyme
LSRDRLRLVDFEFGGACFRGYDLANFFWECSIENQSKAFPGFVIDGDQFPCLEKRRAFLKTYLETFARVTARSGNGGTSSGDTSSGHSDTGCGGGGGNGASTADGNGNGNGSSGATQPPPPNYASKSSAAVACAEKEEDVKAVSSKKEEAAELEALLWEVECFGLASNLQWALWGVHRAPSPSVVSMSDEWSYLDYAVQRASQYHALKARLLPLIEERRKQQQQKQQQQQATAISSSSS